MVAQDIQAALATVQSLDTGNPLYLEALLYLVRNRGSGALPNCVPIKMLSNDDPGWSAEWGEVQEGSQNRSLCGRRRTIVPITAHREGNWLEREEGMVIVTDNAATATYIRPIWSDWPSVRVRVTNGELRLTCDPMPVPHLRKLSVSALLEGWVPAAGRHLHCLEFQEQLQALAEAVTAGNLPTYNYSGQADKQLHYPVFQVQTVGLGVPRYVKLQLDREMVEVQQAALEQLSVTCCRECHWWMQSRSKQSPEGGGSSDN